MKFKTSKLATSYCKGEGLEIGGAVYGLLGMGGCDSRQSVAKPERAYSIWATSIL